jgi:phage-related protein
MLIDFAISAWNGFFESARTVGASMIAWVLALPGRITEALMSLGARLAQLASAAWNGFLNSARTTGASLLIFVGSLPNRIWDILKVLPGRMISIGGDMIRGIWQGIQNLAGWLWNQITGSVGGIVDKVQSLLHIGSPSKVFADEVGQWIPKGIAVGITAHADSIANALGAAFNTSIPAVQHLVSMQDTGANNFMNSLATTQGTPAPQIINNAESSASNVTIANLNIAGNLDPTNPTQWRQALVNIKDGIRQVERQYA